MKIISVSFLWKEWLSRGKSNSFVQGNVIRTIEQLVALSIQTEGDDRSRMRHVIACDWNRIRDNRYMEGQAMYKVFSDHHLPLKTLNRPHHQLSWWRGPEQKKSIDLETVALSSKWNRLAPALFIISAYWINTKLQNQNRTRRATFTNSGCTQVHTQGNNL